MHPIDIVQRDTPMLLMRGEDVLGTLVVQDINMPWLNCSFTPTPAFAHVRPVFAEYAQLRRLAISHGNAVQNDLTSARNRIDALDLRLVVGDNVSQDFLIWIDGTDAGIR